MPFERVEWNGGTLQVCLGGCGTLSINSNAALFLLVLVELVRSQRRLPALPRLKLPRTLVEEPDPLPSRTGLRMRRDGLAPPPTLVGFVRAVAAIAPMRVEGAFRLLSRDGGVAELLQGCCAEVVVISIPPEPKMRRGVSMLPVLLVSAVTKLVTGRLGNPLRVALPVDMPGASGRVRDVVSRLGGEAFLRVCSGRKVLLPTGGGELLRRGDLLLPDGETVRGTMRSLSLGLGPVGARVVSTAGEVFSGSGACPTAWTTECEVSPIAASPASSRVGEASRNLVGDNRRDDDIDWFFTVAEREDDPDAFICIEF